MTCRYVIPLSLLFLLLGSILLSASDHVGIKVTATSTDASIRAQLLAITPLGSDVSIVARFVTDELNRKRAKSTTFTIHDYGFLKTVANPSGKGSHNVVVGSKSINVIFGEYRTGLGLFSRVVFAKYGFDKNGKLIDVDAMLDNATGDL